MKTCVGALFFSFIFLFTAPILSQWRVSGSFSFKNEIPEKGIGINVSRNLPFQRADFGIKIRAGVVLFRQFETEIFNGTESERNFRSEDYHFEIISSFFFRNFSPYFGLGSGYSSVNVNLLNEGSFLLCFLTGLNTMIYNNVSIYTEVQGVNHLSGFDSSLSGRDISSFQLRVMLGISYSINVID